jgi:hypothetical protein
MGPGSVPVWYDSFVERNRRDREQELAALRAPRTALAPRHSQLAAYLFERRLLGRPIEGERLARLQVANAVVERTRSMFPLGRGNVRTDVERSGNRSYRAMRAGRDVVRALAAAYSNANRDVSVDEAHAISAAALVAQGGGNCQEFAELASLCAGPWLEPGETVAMVGHGSIDHGFAELRQSQDHRTDDIIMDAWAEGPPSLREDSRFARPGEPGRDVWLIPRARAQAAYAAYRTHLERHWSNPGFLALAEAARQRYAQARPPARALWPPTSVFSQDYLERSAGAMKSVAAAARRPVTSTTRPPRFVAEVALVGALRSLDLPVRYAVGKANALMAQPDWPRDVATRRGGHPVFAR